MKSLFFLKPPSPCMETRYSKLLNHHDLKKKQVICTPLRSQRESKNPINLAPKLSDNSTPLLSAIKDQAERDIVSFYFPGHNYGKAAPQALSELTGKEMFLLDSSIMVFYDNVLSPKGPILAAQKQAAELFGSSETWFLVGGTTCGVLAAVMATCSSEDVLILPINTHISATNALILSGATPKYILPEYNMYWDITGGVTPFEVQRAIDEVKKDGKKIGAVFLTSPTYQGVCSDVAGVAKLCHSNGIPLIVDEAHGAHFKFHPELPKTALEQGADLVIQSTHKVLCSLSQSSMLHISGSLVQKDTVSKCLQILNTTSPSFLLLASLDATTAELRENSSSIFKKSMKLVADAKSAIQSIPGIEVLDLFHFKSHFPAMDPFRVTFNVAKLGFTGFQANEILRGGFNVFCEMAGKRFLTIALNMGNSEDDISKLVSGLQYLSSSSHKNEESAPTKKGDFYEPFPYININMKLTPREAFFAKKRSVRIEESLGMICGELIVPFPPGVAALKPGEIITEEVLLYISDMREKGASIRGAADPLLSTIIVCDN